MSQSPGRPREWRLGMTGALLATSVCLAAVSGSPSAGTVADLLSEAIPELVEIPAGPFLMGADPTTDPDAYDNERWSPTAAQGTVDLPTFYIARHEVTVAQFSAFAGAGTWRVDPRALEAPPDHPVAFVSWPDALAYGRWLEAELKRSASVPTWLRARLDEGWRVTLPTEAQWEKAARGADGRRFPWGHDPDPARANYQRAGTAPVGRFACPECPFGLADMSGNVWEWTASPYQPYPWAADNLRARIDDEALWVMRGGHFGDPARLVRTTTRGGADPGARRAFIGFRVVLTSRR